uniref:Uncharacterized protein n=1 Tax=Brassica oleracea var. oleracea TaxID=109376 RepID=A0A0D3AT64_BRAOL
MATSYHRVIQFESSFLKKLLFSILVTVWRFMFCLYLSTVESKKSLNGCLRQVESQFQRFVRTVSRRQVDFCCGLLFFSEVSGPLIVNLLLRLKWYSQKFVKGQWDKEDCVAELNNYIDRLSGDYGIVEATAPNFKLQILRNPTYRSYVSSEKQGRSKRGEMHMNSQEDART